MALVKGENAGRLRRPGGGNEISLENRGTETGKNKDCRADVEKVEEGCLFNVTIRARGRRREVQP